MGVDSLVWSFSGALIGSILTAIILPITINLFFDRLLMTLSTKGLQKSAVNSYLFHLAHLPVLNLIKIARRSQTGHPLLQPTGSSGQSAFRHIYFSPVQLTVAPLRNWDSIVTETILGKHSSRPLTLPTPLLLDVPACGLLLSSQVRQVYVQAAIDCHLPLVTGGQLLSPDQQKTIPYYIPTIPCRQPCETMMSAAAMVVMQVGLGSNPSSEWHCAWHGQESQNIAESYQPLFLSWKHPHELARLVGEIKRMTGGIPVAVRMVAGNYLESDLQWCMESGVDVVILETRESDSLLAPEVVSQFGLPLVAALVRAHSYVEKHQPKSLDIVASGGMWSGSDYLKALALGCSATLVGQPALWALLHTQLQEVIPWQSVGDLYLDGGKKTARLKVDRATNSLGRFLRAIQDELSMGTAATGKEQIAHLNYSDLTTDRFDLHNLTGIPWSFSRPSG